MLHKILRGNVFQFRVYITSLYKSDESGNVYFHVFDRTCNYLKMQLSTVCRLFQLAETRFGVS